MKRLYLLYVMAAATLLSGCRKELCYDHDEHAFSVKVDVTATWEQEWERSYDTDWKSVWADRGYDTWVAYDDLRPGIPAGIRAVVYGADGNREYQNLTEEDNRLYMNEGMYSILFYNNDTQYIIFNDLPSSATASATTRTRTRAGFSLTEAHAGERTVSQPDMLYGSYMENYEAKPTIGNEEIPVTLHPLTYTYLIRYEFKSGLQYVALARGALAGMAESVYLQDGHTGSETATILFDDDVCWLTDFGVEARVQSFGIPDYPGDGYGRAAKNYSLNLEVVLNNGNKKEFTFDITDQVAAQPRGGVIVVSGIEISDEEGQAGGSGFDATVDGWGEYEDIELPM